jgi:hypothetical protein
MSRLKAIKSELREAHAELDACAATLLTSLQVAEHKASDGRDIARARHHVANAIKRLDRVEL